MLDTIVRSIVVDGITESAASFLDKQKDIDQKQERLNELLMQINSAIEFAKAREPIHNIWLRKWLEDLQKASRDGQEVQSAFKENTVSTNTIMNPLKVTVRLYQRSQSVNRLNDVVARLERKASGCTEFLRRLRYEFNERRHQTYMKKVGKLERKMRCLRNCLRSLKSDGKFKNYKNTKLPHQPGRADTTFTIFSQPELQNWNHHESENINDNISEQEIQQQDNLLNLGRVSDDCEDLGIYFKMTSLPGQAKVYTSKASMCKEDISIEEITNYGECENDNHDTISPVFSRYREERLSDSATNNLKPLPTVRAKVFKSGNNKHKKSFIRCFFGLFRCIFPILSSAMSTQE